MLRSYRSIPCFHGQHYSYVSVKDRSPGAGSCTGSGAGSTGGTGGTGGTECTGGTGGTGGATGSVGRQLESEGVAHLDCHLIQMVHADLLAGRLADCRIRWDTDVGTSGLVPTG